MYGTYNGIKQGLATDNVAGIDSIYGTPSSISSISGPRNNRTRVRPTSTRT